MEDLIRPLLDYYHDVHVSIGRERIKVTGHGAAADTGDGLTLPEAVGALNRARELRILSDRILSAVYGSESAEELTSKLKEIL